jgi:uncharacterized protein
MTGLIVWHELFTSDVEAATRFYTELLGLELETADMGDFQYPMLRKDGRTHAGFVRKEDAEAPSHWYPYVQVESVDATVELAKELGAELYHGPADAGEGLRFAVLGDPQRATVGVMQWGQEAPTGVFAWDELYAADVDAAARFYGELFAWTTSAFRDGYRFFDSGETHLGGLMQKTDEMPVAAWGTHFATDDVDASAARGQELGATVMLPPTSMEDVGRFAVLADPTGAPFGLYTSEG